MIVWCQARRMQTNGVKREGAEPQITHCQSLRRHELTRFRACLLASLPSENLNDGRIGISLA